MNLILVSDIFGRTSWLDQLALELSDGSLNAVILDPYNGEYCDFRSEDEAYRAFQERTDLESYAEIVRERAADIQSPGGVLLGFSVGASAIWLASPTLTSDAHLKGICFYSSQIRNYLDICPAFEIDVYFAASEPKYDINEVESVLSGKPKVSCFKTLYGHGFLNRASNNFNGEAYRKYTVLLRRSITRHFCP